MQVSEFVGQVYQNSLVSPKQNYWRMDPNILEK